MYLIVNLGFLGGSVVKNPPANAGDTVLIPGQGRSHMAWSNEGWAPQLLSLCSGALKPQLLKSEHLRVRFHNRRSHHNEEPAHHN